MNSARNPNVARSLAAALLAVGLAAPLPSRSQPPSRSGDDVDGPRASAPLVDALGDLRFGMEPREVHAHFRREIEARFRDRIAEVRNPTERHTLRRRMEGEVRRLRESYVRFRGPHSGWDASFLRGEFTHRNGESMIAYRDDTSQNFFFFIEGRLWKWYRALNPELVRGVAFDEFVGALEGRYGVGRPRRGRLAAGGPVHEWTQWYDEQLRLRAVNHMALYGFYAIAYEDRGTLRRLPQLRVHQARTQGGRGIIDAVVDPERRRRAGGSPPGSE